jgi:ribokinase
MPIESKVDVVVVGSLNLDLVVTTARLPAQGETVMGQTFNTFVGGKGFNQAVAARRTGSSVAMVGKLGRDSFGDTVETALRQEEILDAVGRCPDPAISTGIAAITVDSNGKNMIVVVPGTNFELTAADVESSAGLIQQARVLLLQLEIPLPVCQRAAQLAHEAGVKVVLTPAPVPTTPLPTELLANLDLLVLNEVEVLQMAALHREGLEIANDEIEAARQLLNDPDSGWIGPSGVIVTLGERGACWVTAGEAQQVAGFPVTAIDTTAAGDSFTGAIATALSQQLPIPEALRFANAAGALAVTKKGASTSVPTATEIKAFLQGQAAQS